MQKYFILLFLLFPLIGYSSNEINHKIIFIGNKDDSYEFIFSFSRETIKKIQFISKIDQINYSTKKRENYFWQKESILLFNYKDNKLTSITVIEDGTKTDFTNIETFIKNYKYMITMDFDLNCFDMSYDKTNNKVKIKFDFWEYYNAVNKKGPVSFKANDNIINIDDNENKYLNLHIKMIIDKELFKLINID
jgi:hypothetical protein